MFRGDFELAADVVLAQLEHEGWVGVGHDRVEADARAHKHFFDARMLPGLAQQRQIGAVACFQLGTRLRIQAMPVAADLAAALFGTGGQMEIGGRAADIMDVAFKIGQFGQPVDFSQNGRVAARPHDAPHVVGDRAKPAAAVAAPVRRDAEADLLQGRHTALCGVGRMPRARVGQCVDAVQRGRIHRPGRRVLHQEAVLLGLDQDFSGGRILFHLLVARGDRVGGLVPHHLFG